MQVFSFKVLIFSIKINQWTVFLSFDSRWQKNKWDSLLTNMPTKWCKAILFFSATPSIMCLNTVFRDLPLLVAKLGLITHVPQLRHNGLYVINKHRASVFSLIHTHTPAHIHPHTHTHTTVTLPWVEGGPNHFPGIFLVLYIRYAKHSRYTRVWHKRQTQGSLLFWNSHQMDF